MTRTRAASFSWRLFTCELAGVTLGAIVFAVILAAGVFRTEDAAGWAGLIAGAAGLSLGGAIGLTWEGIRP